MISGEMGNSYASNIEGQLIGEGKERILGNLKRSFGLVLRG